MHMAAINTTCDHTYDKVPHQQLTPVINKYLQL